MRRMLKSIAHADRDRAARSGHRRSLRQRGGDPRARWARRSAPVRALVVTPELSLLRLPARGSAAAPGVRRRVRARARRARGGRERDDAARRLSRARDGRCYNALAVIARRPRRATSTASSSCRTTRCSTRSATSSPGTRPASSTSTALPCGLIICEDVWFPEPARQAQGGRVRSVVVVANGSPYHTRQQALRREQVGARARETGAADRLRQSRRRPGRARVRRRVVRGRRATATSSSSFRRGTKRWRSSGSTTACRSPCAARSTRGSSRTSTRRW